MQLEIRAAVSEDAAFLAWVQQEAARSHLEFGFLDLMLPDENERLDYLERMCTTEARSIFHHAGFRIAEVDGEPAAALSGYEPTKVNNETLAAASVEVMQQMGWAPDKLAEIAKTVEPARICFPASPEDRWIIEWVATRPEYRGRGIIARLLRAILDEGRECGYDRAQVSVLIGNAPAQFAYERAGFVVVDEKRHPDFEEALGSPGIRRLHRDL